MYIVGMGLSIHRVVVFVWVIYTEHGYYCGNGFVVFVRLLYSIGHCVHEFIVIHMLLVKGTNVLIHR